jgi:hypothetical protein
MPAERKPRPRHAVRHQPYLHPEDSKRLVAHCAATNTSESAVFREALARYFYNVPSEADLLLRRLDRVQLRLARTQRDVELLTEAFAVFVKLWFAHTPQVAERDKGVARTAAEGRYAQFVEYVSRQFGGGRRFVDDLPQEIIGDERELAAMAETPRGATDASERGTSGDP